VILRKQLTAAQREVHRTGQQEQVEDHAEQVAVPLEPARQVSPPLPQGQPVAVGEGTLNQRAPVHPESLDAAGAPAVSLALQRLERQGHDAPAVRPVDVQPVHPARSMRSESSASSVMHHWSHPPRSSIAFLRMMPIVPAKIAESRSLRDGCEPAEKYR